MYDMYDMCAMYCMYGMCGKCGMYCYVWDVRYVLLRVAYTVRIVTCGMNGLCVCMYLWHLTEEWKCGVLPSLWDRLLSGGRE